MRTDNCRSGELKHVYRAVKINKCDIQYQITSVLPDRSCLTERIKLEKFQGFSKAHNLWEYLRLRGATSWKSGEQVTGLFKTPDRNIFYGDRKTTKGKSLILIFKSSDLETVTIYTYPEGYYPSQKKIIYLIDPLR